VASEFASLAAQPLDGIETTGSDPDHPAKTIAAPYNAANSGGSNLGPTSRILIERLSEDRRIVTLSGEAAEGELRGPSRLGERARLGGVSAFAGLARSGPRIPHRS